MPRAPRGQWTNTRANRNIKRYRAATSSQKSKYIKAIAQRTVNRTLAIHAETKTSQETSTDGLEITHNSYVTLTNNLLQTTNGTADKETLIGDRIGDKISLKGVSLKFMLELNERYSDVTFRIMVVKSARGDFPSSGNLFNGESLNRMMDSINKERYTIVAQKYVHIKAPNPGTRGGYVGVLGTGFAEMRDSAGEVILSRATKIVRMYIPGTKFGKHGVVTYENAVNKPKFFEYSVLCYAYSNFSTSEAGLYNVGRVNESMWKMYYKDM